MAILGAASSIDLIARVAEIIPRYSMLQSGDRVGVAVSGGADSVVLLHVLQRLAAKLEISLLVLHANHELRDKESEEDEHFVRSLAESLDLEIVAERVPAASGNLEQEARRARREFFKRARERLGLQRIALGHTRSDQAETVLFRLLRGSGLSGLAGMRPVSEALLIRPLLEVSRTEVRDWAQAHALAWREDSSNSDSRFTRNRLRNELIPALARDFNPNLEQVLARTSQAACDEEQYWTQQIEPIFAQITKRTRLGLIFQIATLDDLHIAVRRRVIRRALAEIRGDLRGIDMEHVEAILRISSSSHGHDRVIIPGADAFRSFDTLLLARPRPSDGDPRHFRLELSFDRRHTLPFRAGFITLNRIASGSRNCANFEEESRLPSEVIDLDPEAVLAAGGTLTVRNWEPGDELHRPGHKSAEKIKSLFQEQRILLWERRHWPVVVAGEEIVWARSFGAAANFKASGEIPELIRLIYAPATQ